MTSSVKYKYYDMCLTDVLLDAYKYFSDMGAESIPILVYRPSDRCFCLYPTLDDYLVRNVSETPDFDLIPSGLYITDFIASYSDGNLYLDRSLYAIWGYILLQGWLDE